MITLLLTFMNLQVRPLLLHRWGGLGNHRYQVGFSGDVIAVSDDFLFEMNKVLECHVSCRAGTPSTSRWRSPSLLVMLDLGIGVTILVDTAHLNQVLNFTPGGSSGEFSLPFSELIPQRVLTISVESGSILWYVLHSVVTIKSIKLKQREIINYVTKWWSKSQHCGITVYSYGVYFYVAVIGIIIRNRIVEYYDTYWTVGVQ